MNTVDYLKYLETVKQNEVTENKEISYQLPVLNIEKQEEKYEVVQQDIASNSFEEIYRSFYNSELQQYINSLGTKNTNRFRLSEISDCLLKIVYSKNYDYIIKKYKSLLNLDDLHYVLNLHAVKGISTHSYIQDWIKKNNIQNCDIETKLEHEEDGITLVGRTDILVYSDEPYVVEMKSSSKYSDYHQLQLQLQMYILNRNKEKYLNGKEVKKSYLWYYFTRKYYVVKYDEEYVRNFLQYLKILKSILQSTGDIDFIMSNYKLHIQKLKTNNTEHCTNCIYRNICSFFTETR